MTTPHFQFPEPISSAWQALKAGQHPDAVRRTFVSDPRLTSMDRVEFSMAEYRLWFGLLMWMKPVAQRLQQLAPLGLRCAPTVVGLHEDADGHHGLLITRYVACPGEDILPITNGSALRPLQKTTLARFEEEMIRLYQAGLDHAWALRGWDYLRCSSQTGTIVLSGWEALGPLDPDDVEENMSRLKQRIQRLRGG